MYLLLLPGALRCTCAASQSQEADAADKDTNLLTPATAIPEKPTNLIQQRTLPVCSDNSLPPIAPQAIRAICPDESIVSNHPAASDLVISNPKYKYIFCCFSRVFPYGTSGPSGRFCL